MHKPIASFLFCLRFFELNFKKKLSLSENQITPSIRIGYAYDHVVSELRASAPSSHEFMLLFDLKFPKKTSVSPRFF